MSNITGNVLATPVIMLHGLGAHPTTLLLLELYLNHMGWSNTHKPYYPIDKMTFDETMDYVDREITNIVQDREQEIILIGQSMGGVVSNNLHKRGWNIKKAIYIGSPLHGASLLHQLEKILPTKIRDQLYKLPYDYLKMKGREEIPPHPYKTISMGWFFTDFDGCVYKNETILEDEHHIHLVWADHRTIFANPRLWILVEQLLR